MRHSKKKRSRRSKRNSQRKYRAAEIRAVNNGTPNYNPELGGQAIVDWIRNNPNLSVDQQTVLEQAWNGAQANQVVQHMLPNIRGLRLTAGNEAALIGFVINFREILVRYYALREWAREDIGGSRLLTALDSMMTNLNN